MNQINRRDFLKATTAAATTLALRNLPTHAADAAQSQRPNLLYVFADQLRYQSCGYAGDVKAFTPALD